MSPFFRFRFFFVFVELRLIPSSCWSAPPCAVSSSSSIACAEVEAPAGSRGVISALRISVAEVKFRDFVSILSVVKPSQVIDPWNEIVTR